MKKRTLIQGGVAAVAVAALAVTGAVVAQAEESSDEELGKAIDAILEDDRYNDAQVGVVVAEADTGDVIYN
ncbi:MAG: D-alanyl-D-alanine carboxypeptidase/D-alanyl-D-alanine endopeptidase, partial [Stackebrandtia sp.]